MSNFPHFIIIGNIESKRVALFKKALLKINISDFDLLSYSQLINNISLINNYIKRDTVIRLESPGQNYDLTRELIALGANNRSGKCHYAPLSKINSIKMERGKILYPWQWFTGYKSFLMELKDCISKIKNYNISFMNDPLDIITMFDKRLCQKKLMENGIKVPKICGTFKNYEDLIDKLETFDTNKLFIKLPAGSSASGAAAYYNDNNCEYLITTMELIRKRTGITFYDSRIIRKYSEKKDIYAIINWFSKENVHTEFWMQKKKYKSKEFDMRILIVKGKIYHSLLRSSNSPFTNLHLGNERIILNEEIKNILPWNEIGLICEKIGTIFPDSLYCGADIMVSDDGRPYVLELNAFGDHLNDITYKNESSYDTELRILFNSARIPAGKAV